MAAGLHSVGLLVVLVLYLVLFHVECFDVTILHTNDVHARFLQFTKYGSDCSNEDASEGKCFGGIARRHTMVKEIRSSHDNVLFLDAGDQFMGTMWFNVYKGNATSHFMNQLGYDVMCLGNHEFDLGVAPLKRFLDVVTFPVVSANLDITSEPRLQGHVSKRHVVTVDNEQIGIVGYITPETKFISRPGPSVAFTEIADAVREQVAILQGQGVNKIIALGHAGYPTDQLVAEIEGVDIVVGGHTDTFLYSGTPPVSDEPKGAYPTVVTQDGGKQALVVQAYTWGKYLGYLNVTFSDAGDVVGYTGNPILLNASVEEDPTLLQELWTWNGAVEGLLMDPIGYSSVLLDGERLHCRLRECNLGNLITDSIIEYHVNYTHAAGAWAPAAIALVNSGGVRSSIDKGVVTKGEIIAAQPFGNEIDLIRVAGHDLRLQLEHAVNNYNFDDLQGAFLQMSGLKVIYNLNRPAWERVVSVEVRCLECDVPSYSPLDDNMEYNVLINTFLVEGGDGFTFSPIQQQRFNTLDSDTLTEYLRRHNPVYAGEEGRISFDTSGLPDPVSSAVTITTGVTQCLLLLLAVVLCWL